MLLRDEDFWPELKADHEMTIAHYRRVLDEIASGRRFEDPECGDLTDQEKLKAEYHVRRLTQLIRETERGVANENDIPLTDEEAELIFDDL